MIVCHCNVLCCRQVRSAVNAALSEAPASAITTDRIYAGCGVSPVCGGCRRVIQRLIESTVEDLSEPA